MERYCLSIFRINYIYNERFWHLRLIRLQIIICDHQIARFIKYYNNMELKSPFQYIKMLHRLLNSLFCPFKDVNNFNYKNSEWQKLWYIFVKCPI